MIITATDNRLVLIIKKKIIRNIKKELTNNERFLGFVRRKSQQFEWLKLKLRIAWKNWIWESIIQNTNFGTHLSFGVRKIKLLLKIIWWGKVFFKNLIDYSNKQIIYFQRKH